MKVLTIIVAVIGFIAGLASTSGSVAIGILYAIIGIIALLIAKVIFKKFGLLGIPSMFGCGGCVVLAFVSMAIQRWVAPTKTFTNYCIYINPFC
jgi:hypothetical protein